MKSVLRSLDVLELISEHQPVAVGELTKLLDLPKSTVQRTLVTLHEAGWLRPVKDPLTRWEISPRILSIRPPALRDGRLMAAARGPMARLSAESDETVHLCIPNGLRDMILIDRVDCDQPVRAYSPIGDRSPYPTTATGRAIMARMSESEVAAILGQTPREQFDPTPENVRTLHRELARTASTGFSLNLREYRPGVCAIGAAVLDVRRRPIASVCISMPSSRFDRRQVENWARMTMQAAADIGQESL